MAKKIMIQGTASNVGKSILCTGLCRIFAQDGYKVAPFKSQNMALNSAITSDGLEMGRAQVVQAQACGIAPHVDMNPILLKPTGNSTSQVIVNGIPLDTMRAKDYYEIKKTLKKEVAEAFSRLDDEYDIIVIEGAGSPAEINLKKDDFVNMGLASMVQSPVLLVGDIDRGGVFASLYGTVKLLEPHEQELIKGLIINKFIGDVSLLQSGLEPIEELTGKPVLGVVPMLSLDIDDEDSLSTRFENNSSSALLDIVVVRLPKISNFTDFNPLSRYDQVNLRYITNANEIGNPDLLILAGTKNTIDDLRWLIDCGLAEKIVAFAKSGGAIIGICGGYQMLCNEVNDPNFIDGNSSSVSSLKGLGLLDGTTEFFQEKTRTQVKGVVGKIDGIFSNISGATFQGYEIHMGKTTAKSSHILSFATHTGDKGQDGMCNGNVLGCYVHGFFDNGDISKKLIEGLLKNKGISCKVIAVNWENYAQEQYDNLASNLRKSLDMNAIYEILNNQNI